METFMIPEQLYKQSPWDTIVDHGRGIRVFTHPLYVGLVIGYKEMYRAANELGHRIPDPDEIVQRRYEQLEQAYKHKAIHTYVWTHERMFRFQALLDTRNWRAPESEWYAVAADVWTDSEFPGRNASTWRSEVFKIPQCRVMMNDAVERQIFNSITEIEIYRGADSPAHARRGLSWTSDRDKAVWFARRFGHGHPWLATTTVQQKHIAVIFLRRGEAEYVIPRPPRGKVKVEQV